MAPGSLFLCSDDPCRRKYFSGKLCANIVMSDEVEAVEACAHCVHLTVLLRNG